MKKRILWFSNVPLPEASKLMNKKAQPFGGWLVKTSMDLSEDQNIELAIAFPDNSTRGIKQYEGEKITYYAFEPVKIKNLSANKNEYNIKAIIESFSPDLIHFFGTEFPHTFLGLKLVDREKAVISIQGLISLCAAHYSDGMESKYLFKRTIRDFLKRDNIFQQKQEFFNRGVYEEKAIQISKNIIGRTEWDRAMVKRINPQGSYYHCGETLRKVFYSKKWGLEACEKFSVFVSQGEYPLKGLHYIIRALPMIIDKFPNAKLYIGGKNIIDRSRLRERIRFTYYAKYILKLIKEYNLKDNIIFTGLLNEDEMCSRFLKSNVYVNCSNLENSSNSLGEAMLLGVPSVAAYVGGMPSFISHGIDGYLYQANAPYMLAHYINEIFRNEENSIRISNAARKRALDNYDADKNLADLMAIYNKILNRVS